MRRTLPLVLALAALLPMVAASGFVPPQDAETTAGAVTVAHWAGNQTAADARFAPGDSGEVWFALAKRTNGTVPANGTLVAYVNVTSANATLATPNLTITLDTRTSADWAFANTAFTLPANATGDVPYAFHVDAFARDGDNWTALGSLDGQGSLGVETVAPAPPAAVPTAWIVGGAAVLLVAAGAGVVVSRQRAQRRAMRGTTRSQALREVELEERALKRPEEAAVIQQEIRQQEKVKEKRRDLQILEAKRADVLKSMDLLKKRHESGGLTKLQYDNMVAKKQVDLQRIEADIAAMEAEDAGAGAAA